MGAEHQLIPLAVTSDPCRPSRQLTPHESATKTSSDTIASPPPIPTITIVSEHAATPEPINLMPPEDDPFSPQYVPKRALQRRSSRLSRWLEQLQIQASSSQQVDEQITPKATRRTCGPYLAYPHLSHRTALSTFDEDSDSTYIDYVLIEDADIEDYPAIEHSDEPISHDVPEYMTPRSGVRKLNAPASLRNLYLAARAPSTSGTSTSPSSSRLSMLNRPTRITSGTSNDGLGHIRSSSGQTAVSSHLEVPPTTSKRWRPSVLGHFSQSLSDSRLPHDPNMNPSRPSISSTNTSSLTIPTSSTMYEESPPSQTPQKSTILLGSLRSRHSDKPSKADRSSGASPSLWPGPALPQQASDVPHPPSRLVRKASTIRLPFTSKAKPAQTGYAGTIFEEIGSPQPRTVYGKSSGRVSFSSIGPQSRAKKKKLVISGIGMKDTRRLEAAQRWCQSFGEVDEIVRMPNGDLHVNFHRAEVADTVCRVRAKVLIPGVGSVHLSWYTGNKRS